MTLDAPGWSVPRVEKCKYDPRRLQGTQFRMWRSASRTLDRQGSSLHCVEKCKYDPRRLQGGQFRMTVAHALRSNVIYQRAAQRLGGSSMVAPPAQHDRPE
jgi:hypothetical protein